MRKHWRYIIFCIFAPLAVDVFILAARTEAGRDGRDLRSMAHKAWESIFFP